MKNYAPPFFGFFFALADISPEPVNRFQSFRRRLKAEKILRDLYRTDFFWRGGLDESCFQFQFFFYVDFQMHKTHLENFVRNFGLLKITVRPLIFFMTNFKVGKVFSI